MRGITHHFLCNRARHAAGLALPLLLAACAMPAGVATTSPVPPTPAAPTDPILAAVATTAMGRAVSIVSPQYGGTVTVLVRSDYIAASGDECRSYLISSATTQGALALACNGAAGWRNVPPLLAAAGAGGNP